MTSGSESSDSKSSGKSKTSSTTTAPSEKQSTVHYHDWPNTQGFDTHYEERSPVELKVRGTIPKYAAGVLFRTGLGPRKLDINGKPVTLANHWFDGFSQVHRFQIHAPMIEDQTVRVTYNSRLTSDGLIERVRKTGKLDTFTFAAKYDLCRSFFSKVQGVFESAPVLAADEVNNAVTVSINYPGLSKTGTANTEGHDTSSIVTLCNKTDASRLQMLDPETLEPVGLANQTVLHPDLGGVGSGAHAKSDPATGNVYNYNLDIKGPSSIYRIFRSSASTGKTTILATLKHAPAYLHSLFVTENYVILCVWNSHYKAGGASILWTKNLLDAMYFNDKVPATWYVIDKRCPDTENGQGVVASFESDPFFCFHTVNAFEEKNEQGQVDIVADLSVYKDMSGVHHYYMDNLISDSPKAKKILSSPDLPEIRTSLHRYRLPSIPIPASINKDDPETRRPSVSNTTRQRAIREFAVSYEKSMELPTLNFKYLTKPYRYVYGIISSNGSKSSFVDGLVKYDISTGEANKWEVQGHTPGEAIFIPDPDATAEDDGVLLTVVLDGFRATSYLLVLDAKNMTEMGRAEVPGAIGFGFHGIHSKLGLKDQNGIELHY